MRRVAVAVIACGLLLSLPLTAANVLRGDRNSRHFYLTLDAHNDPRGLPEVLEVLRRHQVRATFFITGYFLENFPESAREINRQGHLAANHTWTHSRSYSTAVLRAELERTEQLWWRLTGTRMEKLWRAPYLQHSGRSWLVSGMHREGYIHVDVTLGAKDWVRVFEPGYLDNARFLRAFQGGFDFRRFARMIVCGRSLGLVRGKEPAYQGVIMLYHLGRFRPEGLDFIFSMEQVILFLKRSGYEFRDCRDFLPGNNIPKRRTV